MAEWKQLFDVTLSGVEALLQEKFLVLDTQFFSQDFKDRLLGEFDNLDEETNGLLINSENFQALNLMQEKYKEKVKAIYIDPPYNAKSSEILYKNSFKHASWLSLISDRILYSKELLNSNNGVFNIAIDENEQEFLGIMLSQIFENYNKTCVTIVHNASGQQGENFSYTNEYSYFLYPKNGKFIGFENRPIEEADIRGLRDVTGEDSKREAAKNCFYPIFIKDNKIIGFGDVCKDDFHPNVNEKNENGITAVYPIDPQGVERKWRFARQTVENIINQLKVNYIKNRDVYDIQRIKTEFNFKTVWTDSKYFANNQGTQILNNIIGKELFSFPKSIYTVKDSLKAIEFGSINNYFLDYFAGSGTTGHATIKLNREDGGNRKYILVEMGTYFNTVTKPRIQKVIYTDNWKNGKPQDTAGISQMFKYQVLESYEDTLNNLQLSKSSRDGLFQFSEAAQEDYLLNYMLDVETQDHLFNIQMFRNPFNYQLKVTENNELVPTKVDLVETFNYLIGLYVERMQRVGDIKFVEGKTREGIKTLVIWRNLETTTNEETAQRFRKIYNSVRSSEFDHIYINGDHHFDNIRTGEDTFKVKLIEETFFKKMFNISEL